MIETTDQYIDALTKAYDLLEKDPAPETPEGRLLDKLCDEIVIYEDIHYPMGDIELTVKRQCRDGI